MSSPRPLPMRTPGHAVLTAAQADRARELLADRLDVTVSVEAVARACALSRGHFSQAFMRTIGLSPHAWRMSRRIESAKSMLRDERTRLADVALSCGFCDQAHFSRAFRQTTGMTPGAWRRLGGHGGEPGHD